MKRRIPAWSGVACLACLLAGCDEDAPLPGVASGPTTAQAESDGAVDRKASDDNKLKPEILKNVMRLLETSVTRPGGSNIGIATENLNQYFEGTDSAEFTHTPAARAYLAAQLKNSPYTPESFEGPAFEVKDARHIEDCLLYHNVAARVAGPGDDLERARRLFDWTVRHIQLVPTDGLIARRDREGGVKQVPSRPYDVLSRGVAMEQGYLAERAWVFMALCRQVGVDVGLVSYRVEGRPEPVIWACAALVGGRAYLFDARIGLEIPGPDGHGVATLEEAATDPRVLARLDLPGQYAYPTTRRDLAAGKLAVLIDSSRGYLSPRMRLLQRDLAGRNRMIVFRDPAEQRDAFAAALGDRLGEVNLWGLPLETEYRLFTDPQFSAVAQYLNQYFLPELPLLKARLTQLRGDIDQAVREYVAFRFTEVPLVVGQRPIQPFVQDALDRYATHFLALCQLDLGRPKQAEDLFLHTLKLSPGVDNPDAVTPFPFYEWGANVNLGRLREAQGDRRGAIAYYCREDPTSQAHGNLLRARSLVWDDPFARPVGSAPVAEVGAE